MTQAVFDVVAEYPEEKSIAQNVSPASVQKHRDERREDVDRVIVDAAADSAPKGYCLSQWGHVRELARNHPEVANAGSERLLIEPGSLHEYPGQEHGSQDGICHPWRADSRKLVAEWNHWAGKLLGFQHRRAS